MSAAPKVVLQAVVPFGHLRLRMSLTACGARTWALLPEEGAERPDVPLMTGFLGEGAGELSSEDLHEVACHLKAFELQAEGVG